MYAFYNILSSNSLLLSNTLGETIQTKQIRVGVEIIPSYSNDYMPNQKQSSLSITGGGVAQWLRHWISDQGVPGSNPGRCAFRCGLEQVTFTLLSTG